METDKTPGSVAAFRALVDGIVGDATPTLPDLIPTPPADDPNEWKRKTAPPTFCAVALADATDDPVIRSWFRTRITEMTPAINYKATRLHYLDMLFDMELDDARQGMTLLALEKARKDPLWFAEDNALCAHDAAQRIRGKQRYGRTQAQKWFSYSLDEHTDTDKTITRLDTIAASLAKSWLTFAPYKVKGISWQDADTSESELLEAMRTLPDAQQKTFTLARFWNVPTLEIADALDMPRNTVLSHNHRAKKTLAVQLAHLNYNRKTQACPSCGSRNVKTLDKGKTYNCQVCDRAGLADEFEKHPRDRVFFTGRQYSLAAVEVMTPAIRTPPRIMPASRQLVSWLEDMHDDDGSPIHDDDGQRRRELVTAYRLWPRRTVEESRPASYHVKLINKDPAAWTRTPAASYPMPPRPRPEKLGPMLPDEYPPTIRTLDGWRPSEPPPPTPFDLYLSPPFPGGKSKRDLDAHTGAYSIGPLFDIKTRRQWYGSP